MANLGALVWIDLETTGLNKVKDVILEAACIITDWKLNVIAELTHPVIINRSQEVLDNMDQWCKEQHRKSGLIEDVQKSTTTVKEAEETLFNFIKEHVPDPKKGVLAGSSVHFDKSFLAKELPKVENHLHYRIVDVSSIGELSRHWFPNLIRPRMAGTPHRALDDIRNSIMELRFYKRHIFVRQPRF